MITTTAIVPKLSLRAATLALAILALLTAIHAPARAQSGPSRWELLVSSGTLVPTGTQRGAIARGGVTAAQLSFVPGSVAVTATVGWARTRDVASPDTPKIDAFLYDLGIEVRAPLLQMGAFSLSPFGGTGVGARSYDYRSLEQEATHNLAAFVGVGGEIGVGRIRLRLQLRDYVTGFKPLHGDGASGRRNDVVLLAGLRLAARR